MSDKTITDADKDFENDLTKVIAQNLKSEKTQTKETKSMNQVSSTGLASTTSTRTSRLREYAQEIENLGTRIEVVCNRLYTSEESIGGTILSSDSGEKSQDPQPSSGLGVIEYELRRLQSTVDSLETRANFFEML